MGEELLALFTVEELLLSANDVPRGEKPCTAADEGSSGTGSSLDPDGLGVGSPWPKI